MAMRRATCAPQVASRLMRSNWWPSVGAYALLGVKYDPLTAREMKKWAHLWRRRLSRTWTQRAGVRASLRS